MSKQPIPVQQLRDNEDLTKALAGSLEKNETVEVLKELFDLLKLELITDLKGDHISLITRMEILSDLKNIPQWKTGIQTFMRLRISKDRNSRTELIKAISGILQQKRGIMDSMLNRED